MADLTEAEKLMLDGTPNPLDVGGESGEPVVLDPPAVDDDADLDDDNDDSQGEGANGDDDGNAGDPPVVSDDDSDDGDDNNFFEDWDISSDDDLDSDLPPQIDYSAIGKDAGIEVASKDEFLEKISSYKEENKKLKEDLLKANENIESAEQNQVDFSKIDPKEFFIDASKELFTDETGALDSEALAAFIEEQDPNMITMQGNMIKKQYVQNQKANLEQAAAKEQLSRERADVKLREAIKEFDSFNGFKVKDNHKDDLYKNISTGKAMKEMFYTKDGEYDMSKVVKAYFYYKNGEKMEKYRAQRAKNTAIRDVLDSSTNADLRANGRTATATDPNVVPDSFAIFAKSVKMPGYED